MKGGNNASMVLKWKIVLGYLSGGSKEFYTVLNEYTFYDSL